MGMISLLHETIKKASNVLDILEGTESLDCKHIDDMDLMHSLTIWKKPNRKTIYTLVNSCLKIENSQSMHMNKQYAPYALIEKQVHA
jgi:hypothetical protein